MPYTIYAVEKVFAVIDLKSFYASCECASRGLDIFKTPLAVCDPSRTENTVVMSVTPYLKEKYGCSNVCRIKDLPKLENMILATPRMAYYLEISAMVVSIFLDFVSPEDLHVYSVDESFLNLTPYLKLNNWTPEEMVIAIQKRIKSELGLLATAGIGPNMFMAKICLDNEGKKKPPYYARWTMDDVKTKLWKVSPITKVWGIGPGTASHLFRLGIKSMEEIAKADKALLHKEFGVMGDQLHDLSNGIDQSDMADPYIPKDQNLSIGQTLWRNYAPEEALVLLREMNDDLCFRLRGEGMQTSCVSLFVNYSSRTGGSFHHQMALDFPTDDSEILFKAVERIFTKYATPGAIRGLSISFGQLKKKKCRQLNLFEDPKESYENEKIVGALDEIRKYYGPNACLRGTSKLEYSTAEERHGQIGGHKA